MRSTAATQPATLLLDILAIENGVLIFTKRGPHARYQVGDAVPIVYHQGKPFYRIRSRNYRPDLLIKALKTNDPSVLDADTSRPLLRARSLERNAEIAAMVQQGMTYADIGAKYGVSRQRIKQIAAAQGVNSKEARAQRQAVALAEFHETRHTRRRKTRAYAIYARLKHRAANSGLEFDLTPDDFESLPTHCPVLGIPLNYDAGHSGPADNRLSVDRIDPAKGYTRGNIVLVSMRANRIKNDATPEELQKIADFYAQLCQEKY